jgi:predicted PurR-regulated permease PerM
MGQMTRPALSHNVAAWILMGVGLTYVMFTHLLSALLAGLLVYELVSMLAPKFVSGHLSHSRAKIVVVSFISAIVLGLLIGLVALVVAYFRTGNDLPALLSKMAEIVETSRTLLPPSIAQYLPQGDESQIRAYIVDWLRGHAEEIRVLGGNAGRVLVHVVIGLIIGAIVSLNEGLPDYKLGPLAQSLTERVERLGASFRRVVFAQVRISALNAILTGIYLYLILPSFGISLPFVKTMVSLTFIAGLMPVLGNLVSNTVIVIISLSQGLYVASASLAFLVFIHKLEYFVNARIVGSQIKAHAWELLIAMLAMEAVFGIRGVIAAPVFYAYLKLELADQNLI